MSHARPGRLDGRSLKYLIAIGIALFGVIGYYAKRTRNPVTGEMQSVSLSVDQEKALGLKAAPSGFLWNRAGAGSRAS